MQIHQGLVELKSALQTIVTIGAFDGVHLAHRKILNLVHDEAEGTGLESAVISFWPHPRTVLSQNGEKLELLSTLDEKLELIAKTGIHHLYIIPFTKEFSNWTAQYFVEEILIKRLKTSKLILGYDHHFGNNREGNLAYLLFNQKKFRFKVEAIEEQIIKDSTVSSTEIRNALKQGNIKIANQLLGYSYQFSGTVVKGDQLGRTIGFPTANIKIEEDYKLIPANGVYAVYITAKEKKYMGVMNIGIRPTVDGLEKRIEVNIFDFDQNIYGETIKIEVYYRIREERKFDSLIFLKEQIGKDKEMAIQLLTKGI